MSEPKILIQIALMQNGELAISSSSKNQVTNLGCLEIAKKFFLETLSKKDDSSIHLPEKRF